MKALTRFQYTCLARLIARDLSGTPMKIDCRSLTALRDRGLIRYCGTTTDQTMDGRTRNNQPFMEHTAAITDDGWILYSDDRKLYDEVAMHLRVESKIALEKASSYETTARLLRRRAKAWDEALTQ